MYQIKDLEISHHSDSSRIYEIKIDDQILDKLQFSFNKFDLTALELKPFSRFTIAKSLNDLTQSKLSVLLNDILRRKTGFISPKKISSKQDDKFCKTFYCYCLFDRKSNFDSMAVNIILISCFA